MGRRRMDGFWNARGQRKRMVERIRLGMKLGGI